MKIAIITTQDYHMIGGIETYSRNLYNALPEHDFTEFPTINWYGNSENGGIVFNKNIKNVTINDSLRNFKNNRSQMAGTYPKKILNKIYKSFDLVILSVPKPPKKYLKRKKTILIQHEDQSYYSLLGKFRFKWYYPIGYFFGSLFFGIGTVRNPFKFATNSVFFCKESMSKKFKNYSLIPLPALKEKEIRLPEKNGDGIMFVGRYTKYKGFDRVMSIKNDFDNLKIYGSDDGKKYSRYNNQITHEEVLRNMRENMVLLVTSRSEGFPFTVVEALSSGCLVVMIDDFKTASYFASAESVFLVKNTKEAKEKLAEISKFSPEKIDKLNKESIKFARKNLSKERFQKNWRNYLDRVFLNLNNE